MSFDTKLSGELYVAKASSANARQIGRYLPKCTVTVKLCELFKVRSLSLTAIVAFQELGANVVIVPRNAELIAGEDGTSGYYDRDGVWQG